MDKEIKEEIRICAFIDALGSSSIACGDNEKRRYELAKLLYKISKLNSQYGIYPENFLTYIRHNASVEVTTFSDNIVISMPIRNENFQPLVHEIDFIIRFLTNVFQIYWDGAKSGILFRGAITCGKLIHNKDVVVGKALVDAVGLEKEEEFPRVIISDDLIENSIIPKSIIENNTERVCGVLYLNPFSHFKEYLHERNNHREQAGLPYEEFHEVIWGIRCSLIKEWKSVKIGGNKKAIKKWDWFMAHFEKSFEGEGWSWIPNALEAAKGLPFK